VRDCGCVCNDRYQWISAIGIYDAEMIVSVGFVIFDDVAMLDVVGPSDVFTFANQIADRELYRLRVLTPRQGAVTAESGMRVMSDEVLSRAEPPHTLVIAGGNGVYELIANRTAMKQVDRLARGATRVVSVCTGAFVLAELGLLDGRRATTHWANADELAQRYPKVDVVADALFVHSGNVVTAAGVAAGLDAALAIVADDHGTDLARRVSRRMVLYLQRSGGQSQFGERAASIDPASSDPLDSLLAEIVADPKGDFTNAALARRLSMSERHVSRLFRDRTGASPAQWVARVRTDHARQRLEQTSAPLSQIADQVGFGSVDTMRQVFARIVQVSPQEYRRAHGEAKVRQLQRST